MTPLLKFNTPTIAHRGASGYAPENTLSSFTKAALLGITWLEFDVMQAACGELVIFHDDLLDRTTSGKGKLIDYPYADLCNLDAGSWFDAKFSGEQIPTFTQMLTFLVEHPSMSANIEIKPAKQYEEKLVQRIWHEISLYPNIAPERLLFSSFSISALRILRSLAPDCQIGLLMHEPFPKWQQICDELNCVSVHVNQRILTQKLANEVKATRRALLSYTVNDPLLAKKLFDMGVDAVFSDVPDKILKSIKP